MAFAWIMSGAMVGFAAGACFWHWRNSVLLDRLWEWNLTANKAYKIALEQMQTIETERDAVIARAEKAETNLSVLRHKLVEFIKDWREET